ncbi:hypothetical protein JZU68_00935, partial [bacterium]|nr:hypothetical protein [bacterium]
MKQIDIESRRLGLANTFMPLNIKPESPKPSGNAIAINFDVQSTDVDKKLTIPILNKPFDILANYYIEYDLKVEGTVKPTFCFFSPLKDGNPV